MRRALAVVVLAASLTSCSSDPEGNYCDELAGTRDRLVTLALGSGKDQGAYLEPALRLFEGLRAKSPSSLRDEWDTFVFAWSDLVEVLDETGVDPTTFDPEKRPAGLSKQDFDRVRAAAAELGSARVRDAVRGITEHADQVCDVSLDL